MRLNATATQPTESLWAARRGRGINAGDGDGIAAAFVAGRRNAEVFQTDLPSVGRQPGTRVEDSRRGNRDIANHALGLGRIIRAWAEANFEPGHLRVVAFREIEGGQTQSRAAVCLALRCSLNAAPALLRGGAIRPPQILPRPPNLRPRF